MSTLPPASSKPVAAPSGTDHDALPPGTRFGEFEIVRVLGVGGFGIVYLAKDHSLERDVALKEYMPASLAARGQGPQITVRSSAFAETYAIGLRSFVNEARLLARFDHPSLVKVYRFWEDNATAYMVMPYLQGVTLRDTRRAMAHPPNEAWVRSVIAPILSALELLHREGVYHRDIAPDNILLPHDGPPVLLDFGAARRVISDRTQSLTAILKPSYAPIEQYAEMAQMRQGPWTDLYALGAVIHYLLFGAPPPPATARAVQDEAESIESRIVPGVSPRFLEAVSWMLSLRPNQRPQNGEQLRAVLDGHAVIPPRGRPGITIPGALAPITPAAFEATRVADAAESNRGQGRAGPGQPPQSPAAAAEAKATFSPTAQMPTARQSVAAPDTPVTAASPRSTVPPGAQPTFRASTTVPPRAAAPSAPAGAVAPGRAASRPATLPPSAVPGQPATAGTGTTRPVPLATQPPRATAVAGADARKGGSSMLTWLAVGGVGAIVVVVAALGGWQFARQQGPITAQAASGPEPAPRSAALPGVLPIPSGGSPSVTATAPQPSAAAVPPTVTAPRVVPVPPVATASSTTPVPVARVVAASAVVAEGTAVRAPAPTRPVAAAGPDTLGSPPALQRPLPTGSAMAPGMLEPNTSTARSAGRPVPRVAGDSAAQPPSGTPVRVQAVPGYGAPVPPAYGSDAAPRYGQGSSRDTAGSRVVPDAEERAEASTAREACGKRVFIALAVCIEEKCEEPRFRQTQECVGILARKASRELR